ncbi:MAG: citrate/2-methylcitrate synthase [Lachnospiraceae bacterium]|nr:citrate/2-methylcitrate synthase [Lachnospiraceae bacterium]MDY5741701.1 citrate/2-methylcitrate synthase [Lachnospiraceae bacterium]
MKDEYRYLDTIADYAAGISGTTRIDPELYTRYEVKRGLRDISGSGVLTGLTDISEVTSHSIVDSEYVPCPGRLYYRGYNIKDLVQGFIERDDFGFEEVTYLLLFNKLPNAAELAQFKELLAAGRELPDGFTRDNILNAPSKDMMNALARAVLTLYSFDDKAEDTSVENVLRQSINLIGQFPRLAVYAYQGYRHFYHDKSLIIHAPRPELSTAENILRLLRPDKKFSRSEAKILDIALVLHMEHGGGNNSTFTNHVVTSSGTDTYSAVAASLGSLKGPKHGGANIKVAQMFEDMKKNVSDWTSEQEVGDYLRALLHKQAFDQAGLIYGMGHAVYSISDPRAEVMKSFVEVLSREKNRMDEFYLYSMVETLAPRIIGEERRIYKGVSANIDFYSGLVYSMLDLPNELFTPIFAIARIVGWSAHRIEELINGGKIIRPAYKSVAKHREYKDLSGR